MRSAKLAIKRSLKSAASLVRLGYPRTSPGSINIIAYHRVVADIAKAERESIYGIVISSATFRRHCEMLSKEYDVVSLETARHFIEGKCKRSRPVAVITFDDGYLDFYEVAFPILKELGLCATVFLPTNFIGQTKPLAHDRIFWLVKQALKKSVPIVSALIRAGVSNDLANKCGRTKGILRLTNLLVFLPDAMRERLICEIEKELGSRFEKYPAEYQLLSWAMVREMSAQGINFGGHTSSHVILPLEDLARIEDEIANSKRELETQLGVEVNSFAYPNGEYDRTIRRIVANAGYKIAVTTEKRINGIGSDLLTLGRTSLSEESTRGIGGVYSNRIASLRLGV